MNKFKEYLDNPEMYNKLLEAYKQATVSKGKNKGKLKSKCPKLNTLGSAAWMGLQTNPFKIGSLIPFQLVH